VAQFFSLDIIRKHLWNSPKKTSQDAIGQRLSSACFLQFGDSWRFAPGVSPLGSTTVIHIMSHKTRMDFGSWLPLLLALPHFPFFSDLQAENELAAHNPNLRDCLKKRRWPAAGDFGCGRGGEFRASPQRAVRNEPTKPTAKSTAAGRVFTSKPVAASPRRARPAWTQKQAASAFSDSL
jgi:hypothetical protein